METKHLDTLLTQATQGPFVAGRPDMATIVDGCDSKWIYAGDKYIAAVSSRDTPEWNEVMANARLMAILLTHGPAMVAALKYYAGTAIGARAADILLKLDQEAKG